MGRQIDSYYINRWIDRNTIGSQPMVKLALVIYIIDKDWHIETGSQNPGGTFIYLVNYIDK